MRQGFFDLRIVYSDRIEGVFKALSSLGFGSVAVSMSYEERERIKDVKQLGKNYGLEVLSRADLSVESPSDFHTKVSRARSVYDLVCIRRAEERTLRRVNLRKADIYSISTLSSKLAWKIRGMGVYVEFEISEAVSLIRERKIKALSRLIRLCRLFDDIGIPIIISSGARGEGQVVSPVEMTYSFSALLAKDDISKRHILTYPQKLISQLKLVEGA